MTKKSEWLFAIKQTRIHYRQDNHPSAVEHLLCKVAENEDCDKCIFKCFKSESPVKPYCYNRACMPYNTRSDTPFPPEPSEKAKILYFFELLYDMLEDIHGSHFNTLTDPLMNTRILAADKEAAK